MGTDYMINIGKGIDYIISTGETLPLQWREKLGVVSYTVTIPCDPRTLHPELLIKVSGATLSGRQLASVMHAAQRGTLNRSKCLCRTSWWCMAEEAQVLSWCRALACILLSTTGSTQRCGIHMQALHVRLLLVPTGHLSSDQQRWA